MKIPNIVLTANVDGHILNKKVFVSDLELLVCRDDTDKKSVISYAIARSWRELLRDMGHYLREDERLPFTEKKCADS